ncbi:MAG TPA: TolC family protein [Phycisphaerae bacterium]|nr:TolC family protein [Phycisphaerae bacterium]
MWSSVVEQMQLGRRRVRYSLLGRLLAGGWLAALAGCQWAVDDADREVYRLIETRQQAAVGRTADAKIDRERWPDWNKTYNGNTDNRHAFVPHPVDNEIPESFRRAATQSAATLPEEDTWDSMAAASQPSAVSEARPTTAPASAPALADRPDAAPGLASQPTTEPLDQTQPAVPMTVLSLADALKCAFRQAREFQTAKEELYLAALALSLERHLWTPQLVGEIRSRYANYGQIRDFDRAMDAVSQVAVEQRLPYGGQITATVINSLMRDLTNHLTSGETGRIVLAADIPLLRGAGHPAYESRYQAERDLIYAVRVFERFRQSFSVNIASDYFQLQQLKQNIANVTGSIKGFTLARDYAKARWLTGRVIELDFQRAEQDRLSAINRQLDAIEAFRTALETFKIRLGLPPDAPVDVESLTDPAAELGPGPAQLGEFKLEDAIRMPQVTQTEAVKVGVKYRLDLLNVLDRIDDRRRGVDIAENNLLPSLNAAGSVTYDTDPTTLGMFHFEDDRATWRGGLNLELPLDRKAERNALRGALIDKERATRNYEEARDEVAAQIRQAIRRVLLQEQSLRIQILSRDLALERREAAQRRFEQGRVSNREVTDAENSLLTALNALARAQVQYRLAILSFTSDTGILRVSDEGQWTDLPGQGG